jgi:hypothetical protein
MACVHFIAKTGVRDSIQCQADAFSNQTTIEKRIPAILEKDDEPCITQVTKVSPSAYQIPLPESHEQYTTSIIHTALSDAPKTTIPLIMKTAANIQEKRQNPPPHRPSLQERRIGKAAPTENFLLAFLKDPKN